jgi:hypothetical protein
MDNVENTNPLSDARLIVPCKPCVFAQWDGKTQIGCRAGMLDKLKDNGAEIIEVYDTETESYVIKNRVCMMRRLSGWRERWADKDIDALLEIADKEVYRAITTELLVYVGPNWSEHEVAKGLTITLDSVVKEEVKPIRITFITNNSMRISKMVRAVKKYELMTPQGSKLPPWFVEYITDRTDDDQMIQDRAAIDIFAKTKCIAPYYIIAECGKPVRQNIFSYIKEKVIREMKMVLCERGDDDGLHNEIVHVGVHMYLRGNWEINVCDKIESMLRMGTKNEQT